MKLFLATATAVSLLFSGLIGLHSTPKPTVISIHAFEEPLVAIGGDSSANNDSALITALQTYQKRQSYDDVSAITSYLTSNPQSPWKFSLLANLGIVYRKAGYFSRALDAWEQAWALGKGEKDVHVQALANRVVAELASLSSSLGRSERLEPLFKEIKGRKIYGPALNQLNSMKENLWLMKNKPGDSFKCGPYALNSIRAFSNRKNAGNEIIRKAQSSSKGFSLVQVRDLSNQLKMNYQMAKRQPGAEFIIPSVTHWKSGHYAALLKKVGNLYLTQDPTFGQDLLVTPQALEDESSGYWLVPSGPLPTGWQSISDEEGGTVWGRGLVTARYPSTKPKDPKCPCSGSGSSNGMAIYNMFAMEASLSIQDTPVGYKPMMGPDIHFPITYNEMEYSQPALSTAFNFGMAWNCAWLSYVNVPTSTGATATVNVRGGGQETYLGVAYTSTSAYPGYVGYYGFEPQSQATLWVTNSTPPTYERRLPDGSKEVFQQLSSPTSPTQVFLTAITDPQGNTVKLSYDTTSAYYLSTGNQRLMTVTDATGLPTQLSYTLSGDPLKVTQITDPYNRSANFGYTSYSGTYQLTSITDVIGIVSSFTYDGTTSNITSMVTPYGTTSFTASTSGTTQMLNVTEPDGSEVYAESRIDGYNYPYTSEPYPASYSGGYSYEDSLLNYRNTYYWDKKAMQATGNNPTSDYTQAHIYHFLHTEYNYTPIGEGPILESEKPALENRIWYSYPNQPLDDIAGTSGQPIEVARVIGSVSNSLSNSQIWQYQYYYETHYYPPPPLVTTGLTAVIDPYGRQTNYTYDATTGIDLTQVTQTTGTGIDILKTLNYDPTYPPHCPKTITDAAGQTTTYTYNSQGQVTSVTPPTRAGHSAETTAYYYTGNFLTSITGPISGAVTTFTPDSLNGNTVNRVKTRADSESYTLTYSYDNLDRVTQISYPDSTTETFSYLNPTTSQVDLDLHSSTDRLGRTTTRIYNAVRQMTSITDPLSRTTHYGWCTCGALISMTDPNGNITYFNRDLESRLTSKVYPGETQPPATPDYTYDTIGRLATYTDKRGDVATYSYADLDNNMTGISYSLASGTAATPNLTYAYDTYYNRLTSVGGVSIGYVSAGSLGGGQPLTVTNTLTGGSAAVTYTYDEWGRKVGSNIDSANSQSVVFDSLGRVTNVLNLLAPTTPGFAYSYFDPTHPTNRVSSISYPNGQSTVYNYFGNTGNERLEEINNLTPSSTVLSQDNYTYNSVGTIATWQHQTDSNPALLWTEGYDTADQLTSAVRTNIAITSPAILSNSYVYDSAGNSTSQVGGGVTRAGSYNSLNQLTGSTPSGTPTMQLTGLLNGAATVTVNGGAATVNSSHYFSGSATVTAGTTNTLTVVATDSSGNQRTNHYQVVVPAQLTYSPTFDADGNELSDGAARTFTWDAQNELASITYTGGASTLFSYDALGRRISIVEKNSGGTVTSTKQLVWDGSTVAEERDGSSPPVVSKRFYAQGEQIGGASSYYTRDHLGSVREMTDGSGNIQARYDYDPYGRVTSNNTLATQSNVDSGEHQHYFLGATTPMGVSTGDTLTVYLYLDPTHLPSEVMLQWHDTTGSWEHRAYWGTANLTWGVNGTNSQRSMGALPSSGQWVLLQVPASQVGLGGLSVDGMAFSLYNGSATWENAGKISSSGGNTIFVGSAVPAGATTYVDGGDAWNWVSGLQSDFQYAGYYEHATSGLNLTEYRTYDPNTARWLSRDPLKKAEIKEGPNLYEYVKNNPIDATDPNGLGTWTFDTTNISAQMGSTTIDAFYTMDADECKCCNSAVVDRYVSTGYGGMTPDDTMGGNWQPPNQAHAEADSPQGFTFRLPYSSQYGYTLSSTYVFRFNARCTSGPWSGKTLSTTSKSITSSGHPMGSNYNITIH